jgi:hypothetical protein
MVLRRHRRSLVEKKENGNHLMTCLHKKKVNEMIKVHVETAFNALFAMKWKETLISSHNPRYKSLYMD